jgi:hypothetical protein
MFDFTKDSLTHISMLPLEELKMVLTDTEKTSYPGLTSNKNDFKMKVSPNSPVARTVIEDKVIDMLLFLSLRHFKHTSEKGYDGEKRVTFDTNGSKRLKPKDSRIMSRLIELVKLMVFEMHSYDTPLSPFV